MIDFEKIGRDAVTAVYGKVPDAPKGYEFTGEFRVGKRGDYYAHSMYEGVVTGPLSSDDPVDDRYNRRLILRRKMVKRETGWTVRKLGRPPIFGEYYTDTRFAGIPQVYFRHSGESCHPAYEAVAYEKTYEDAPEPTE